MKNIFLYTSMMLLSLSYISCNDEETQEIITTGDASSIYISSEAGRREIPLKATCEWIVERDSLTRQWINIEHKKEKETEVSIWFGEQMKNFLVKVK